MFGLGVGEWMVILMIIVMVIRPTDIPVIKQTVRKWYRLYRQILSEIQDSFEP